MIKISRRLTAYEKEKLLEEQNKQRKKYGLQPLKTLRIENLIYLPTDKTNEDKEEHPTKNTDGGMYQ